MEWIAPKTNWKTSDYFNVADYNRIKSDIEYLDNYAKTLYNFIEINALNDVTTSTIAYANLLNDVEDDVQSLADETFTLSTFQPSKTFTSGQSAWNYNDLNRIESNLLNLKVMLESQKAGLKHLAFELGGVQF